MDNRDDPGHSLAFLPSSNMLQHVVAPLTPLERIAQVTEDYETFERIKRAILGKDDTYVINGKERVTATGWERIATAASISVTITSSERHLHEDVDGKKFVAYAVTVRGRKGDREMDATGRAQSDETGRRGPRFPKPLLEHNVETLAHTRAKNRAICALAGGTPADIFEEVEAHGPTDTHRTAKPIRDLLLLASERGIVSTPAELLAWAVAKVPSLRDVKPGARTTLTVAESLAIEDLINAKSAQV